MDPLSIAASVAGLLTITLQAIEVCNGLYHDVKTRSTLLKNLVEDLNCLSTVLQDLSKHLSGKPAGEELALNRCLTGCNEAIINVHDELTAIRALFQKNIVAKTWAQVTFKKRMSVVLESHERVDRFTNALNVALAVRQHLLSESRSQSVHNKLDALAGAISEAKRVMDKPLPWLEPLQQYVADSTALLQAPAAVPPPLSGLSSNTTLADQSRLSDNDDDSARPIASYGSFDEWLDSLTPKSDDSGSTADDSMRGTSTAANSIIDHASETPSNGQCIELDISDLPIDTDSSRNDSSCTLKLRLDSVWDEALKVLKQKGYPGVCGFRMGTKMIAPVSSSDGSVRVTVTTGKSTYSLARGLQINIDQPLNVYLENFARTNESNQTASPMRIVASANEGKIEIHDFYGETVNILELGFCKTLRVPEDGTLYNVPVLSSSLPVVSTDRLQPSFSPHVNMRAGLVLPLWQREALALTFSTAQTRRLGSRRTAEVADFAVKVHTGSVNTVSGSTGNQTASITQDYVVVPGQDRLDGYLAGPGVIRQFVAMPLGSGYTAEGQLMGQELFGGIQVLVAPRFRAKGAFSDRLQATQAQHKTPRELGFRDGDVVFVSGEAVAARTGELKYQQASNYLHKSDGLFHNITGLRPLFVHEVLSRYVDPSVDVCEFSVQAVTLYHLDIVVREPGSYADVSWKPGRWEDLRKVRCNAVRVPEQYSPFIGVTEIAKYFATMFSVHDTVLFTADGNELPHPTHYIPICEFLKNNTTLFCQGYARQDLLSTRSAAGKRMGPRQSLKWDMGLALGGTIKQAIKKDLDPLQWNWERARLINVHIINALMFESMTGVAAPPSAFRLSDYIDMKLPFLQITEVEGLSEHVTLRKTPSVGQIDDRLGIRPATALSPKSRTIGCVVCKEMLADTTLKPCMHVFCGRCVREHMCTKKIKCCGACRTVIKVIVPFAAPMEIPLKTKRFLQTGSTFTNRIEQESTAPLPCDPTIDGQAADERTNGIDCSEPPSGSGTALHIEAQDTRSESFDLAYNDRQLAKVHEIVSIASPRGTVPNLDETAAFTHIITAPADLPTTVVSVPSPSLTEADGAVLQTAVAKEDVALVTALLSSGADPNPPIRNSCQSSPLELAAATGNIVLLAMLVQHGASLQAPCQRKSALHIAAENNHEAAVALLLAYGCDANAKAQISLSPTAPASGLEEIAATPSTLAARNGHLGVIRILQRNGAFDCPLLTACAHGCVGIVKYLLDILRTETKSRPVHGDWSRYRCADYSSLLREAVNEAARHGHIPVLKLLDTLGATLTIPAFVSAQDDTCESGQIHEADSESDDIEDDISNGSTQDLLGPTTALHEAAVGGSVETIRYLLSLGSVLDESRVYDRATPLWRAAKAGQHETFVFLLEQGANIHCLDVFGKNVVEAAAASGSIPILRIAFEQDVDLLGPWTKCTVLFVAIRERHEQAALEILSQLVVKHRFMTGLQKHLGEALDEAAEHGQVNIVRELLKRLSPDTPYHREALVSLSCAPRELDEDALIECAELLFHHGARYTALDEILYDLTYRGYLALATVFLERCPERDDGETEMQWSHLIRTAIKDYQSSFARALIQAYLRQLRSKSDAEECHFLPRDPDMSEAVVEAADSGQTGILDLLLACSSKEDIQRYVLDAAKRLQPNDHMRRYLEDYLASDEDGAIEKT